MAIETDGNMRNLANKLVSVDKVTTTRENTRLYAHKITINVGKC